MTGVQTCALPIYLTILNSTFQKITGNDGGTLYNNNSLTIINSTIHTTKGNAGGAIYNNNRLIIISSLINNTRCNNLLGGGAIYNKGELKMLKKLSRRLFRLSDTWRKDLKRLQTGY